MGTSRVILLSGIYLIFGFYIEAFSNLDETMFKSTVRTATMSQSEELAATGLSLAKGYMADQSSRYVFGTRTYVNGKDTVRYSASRPAGYPASQTLVTSTASHYTTVTLSGVSTVKVVRTVTQSAVFQYHNNRWKQVRVFTSRYYNDSF